MGYSYGIRASEDKYSEIIAKKRERQSAPGSSTSSEIPLEEQKEMGLTDGLIRFSIGLDADIERTYSMMTECMKEVGIL